MINDTILNELIRKAASAPSADNMQPWEFQKRNNTIEVFHAVLRTLPNDVMDMFTWVSIGAAIQNILIAASEYDLDAYINYASANDKHNPIAIISFNKGKEKLSLAEYINLRSTNRNPYTNAQIATDIIETLNQSVQSFNANIHWTTSATDFGRLAYMDAHSSYIRLEHKPLHDELFSILRFTSKDIENTRFGLTFESLGVPKYAVLFAKLLKYWSVNQIVCNMGIGRLVAKQLSDKLKAAGGICLITAKGQNTISYMEAGRAMEQIWLTATKIGLSVQPYGVLPQYFTKIEVEPETFLPKYITALEKHIKPFYEIFPRAASEFPAIVLRVGYAKEKSARSDIRLDVNQLIKIFDSNNKQAII